MKYKGQKLSCHNSDFSVIPYSTFDFGVQVCYDKWRALVYHIAFHIVERTWFMIGAIRPLGGKERGQHFIDYVRDGVIKWYKRHHWLIQTLQK